jgi:general secretion pathway protein L
LYVPESLVPAYQEAVNNPVDPNQVALNKRIDVFADNWSRWIAGANVTTLDLMAGLGLGTGPVLDWRAWRWPLVLAAAVLLINITALNIDWWRMKGETNALRASMIQIYKSAYPKESVIIDPIAQMQQKIAAAKRNSGLAAADDFTAITAAFGEAWSGAVVAAGKTTAIAALEYRERSLFVRLKSGSDAPTQQMKAALTKRDLLLDLAPEQSGAVVWQIRSAK